MLLLAVHIIGGSIALLSAVIALATKKGGSQHKFFGKLYVGGMLGVFLSALLMGTSQRMVVPLLPYQHLFVLVSFGCYFVIQNDL